MSIKDKSPTDGESYIVWDPEWHTCEIATYRIKCGPSGEKCGWGIRCKFDPNTPSFYYFDSSGGRCNHDLKYYYELPERPIKDTEGL